MPIKPAQDANGNWIWVDATTGQPAVQPGGEGTAFVAPSEAPLQPAAPGARVNTLDQIIASLGAGWHTAPGGQFTEGSRKATQADVNAMATQPGWDPTNPKLKVGDTISDPTTMQVSVTDDQGNYRTIVVKKPTNPDGSAVPLEAMKTLPLEVIDYGDTPSGAQTPAETARTKAATDQAKAQTESIQKQIEQLANDEAERQKNEREGFGRITDKDRASLEQMRVQSGISQGQLDLARQQMVQNGINAAGQLAVAQEQLKIAQANQKLSERRLELDEIVRQDASKKDWALAQLAQDKFEFDKVQTASENELKRLTQQQGNEIASGNLKVSQDTLQQRRDEAAATREQNAQTNAITAASTILSSERQAQSQGAQAGANLLGQRASAAGNVIQNVLGLAGQGGRYGGGGGTAGLSGGMMSAPAGLGGLLTQGAANYSADLMGGQKTLDAAAHLVQRAGGDTQSPASQAAIGVLSQMLDKYQQLNNGQPHPATMQNVNQPQMTAGTTSPLPQPAPATTGASLGAVAQPFGPTFTGQGSTGVFGNSTGFTSPAAVTSESGGFRAPQPMIVINTGSMQRGPLMG